MRFDGLDIREHVGVNFQSLNVFRQVSGNVVFLVELGFAIGNVIGEDRELRLRRYQSLFRCLYGLFGSFDSLKRLQQASEQGQCGLVLFNVVFSLFYFIDKSALFLCREKNDRIDVLFRLFVGIIRVD